MSTHAPGTKGPGTKPPGTHAPSRPGPSALPDRGGPGGRAAWLALSVVTALLIAASCAGQAWGLVNRHTQQSSWTQSHAVRTLEVAAGAASVSIVPGPAHRVLVRQKLIWSTGRPHVTRTWAGDTLRIGSGCGHGRFFLLQPTDCEVALDITVPPDVSVQVVDDSGSVAVRGLSGPVDTRTDSGETHVSGLSGRLTARTGSGTFTGDALRSRDVAVRAGSGSAELHFAAAPDRVSATADSGSAQVTVPPGERYRVGGHSGSGSRDIDLAVEDPSAPRTIDVSTDSGSSTVGYR